MLNVNRNPSAREVDRFRRLWLPLAVAIASVVLWWRGVPVERAAAVWIGGGMLAALCLLDRRVARTVFVTLSYATFPIGWVVGGVALAVVYFLVLTPIAWIRRLGGRDPLHLSPRPGESGWHARTDREDPERAFRQY